MVAVVLGFLNPSQAIVNAVLGVLYELLAKASEILINVGDDYTVLI